ncbi:MAG TPA: flagellar basal body P-ring protein FlgI [Bryobacteraceae bacterium]|jgi:flagellar P-ring protein precursor FlgI|nr:flagellar basal body P-ring protein FlgI [Bryobacteraceae bacterium]
MTLNKRFKKALILVLTAAALASAQSPAPTIVQPVTNEQDAAAARRGVRLKDLVTIEGVRANQLIGYGLVVGLNGTGDRQQTLFSAQSLTNLLQRMGVSVSPTLITVKNTAAVMVTATLPAYAQPGTSIDATVAAIGDATNLQGGLLVLTTLRGINGQVFATVQGPLVTGGFIAGRGQANSQTVNHPTVGRIPNGVTVERTAPSVPLGNTIKLQLKEADFTTAARVSEAVNKKFNSSAHAENSSLVTVNVPSTYANRSIEFMAELERLTVEPDEIARVVINERTGTVVLGNEVRISPVAIMHGNLTVEIQTHYAGIPAGPFSSAPPTVVPDVSVGAKDEKSRNILLKEGATVEELVKSLAAIGSTTRDVIAILESLRAAGALEAQLEVI